jgi:hypothetical protein
VPSFNDFYLTEGFRLECEGIWLGEDKVTQWLNLNFQPSKPGEEIRREWMYALTQFKNGTVPEISTIIDRLPLDTVPPLTYSLLHN